ncbi:SpoIIE family protein phosphatase [Streptomyces sp. TR06-5]|uniref:SpoIIE family protein phosphatase n=1 Tax=unclassified Streptomyces TaxID=2593676 RepID=UPI0039A34588
MNRPDSHPRLVDDAARIVTDASLRDAPRSEGYEGLVEALFSQSVVGFCLHDADLKVVRTNLSYACAGSRGEEPTVGAVTPDDVLEPEDAARISEVLRRVLETGEAVAPQPYRARFLGEPESERVVSLMAVPLGDVEGHGPGVMSMVLDVTDTFRDQRRLAMVNDAADRIGTSLDVGRCAEELSAFFVPDVADLVAVDLTEVVLVGEEPGDVRRGVPFTRMGVASVDGDWPEELYQPGETATLRTMEAAYLREHSSFIPDYPQMREAFAEAPDRARLLLPRGGSSYMFVPLQARGLVLGSVNLWRTGERRPFDEKDAELAEEVVTRAALAVDNARRYTQERRTAEALRRSLLPPSVVEVSAAEAAGTCLAAATTAGIGGTWFDVIPLSSARVAFVVGDSVGHGLEATAATGRLRTAVQTLSDLDLPPDELLAHLDDLVLRLTADDPSAAGPSGRIKGSTCLYATFDPVSGRCSLASAGHPPPALVTPDGEARLVDCEPGPALGEGGEPFELVEVVLEPGELLALYSANLPAPHLPGSPDGDVMAAVTAAQARLCRALGEAVRSEEVPSDAVRNALGALVPEPPDADTCLLVARPRRLPVEQTAEWEFPADPAIVGEAREAVAARLVAWGLEELVFTTELIASELVTNAIRYAGGPVQVRLIKDETLICEVSDPTQTHPHLRRARPTDEGGRGLFLIHQLTRRWGSRYTPTGKTIWTGQPLPDSEVPVP